MTSTEIVVEIQTPCNTTQLENVLTKISHSGGCLDAIITSTDEKIIFRYKEHKH